MKNNVTLLLVLLIVLSSCFKKKSRTEDTIVNNQTPDALAETKPYDISSKRYSKDIIAKLFDEAMQKDVELKVLNDKVELLYGWGTDSLQAYHKYSSTNSEYWSSANQYIHQISDSSLRKQYTELFASLKIQHSELTSENDTAVSILTKKKQVLNDYFILVKLMVTQQMISNYQKNELPDIKPIKGMIKEYDSIIEVSKSIIKKTN